MCHRLPRAELAQRLRAAEPQSLEELPGRAARGGDVDRPGDVVREETTPGVDDGGTVIELPGEGNDTVESYVDYGLGPMEVEDMIGLDIAATCTVTYISPERLLACGHPIFQFDLVATLFGGVDAARAQQMLDHMIAYLRATLDASRAANHPLQAEFDRLRDYLELMAIRMGPRLSYAIDLPPQLADWPVPTLLLQPVVENSIQHGLEPKVEGGRITVSARLTAAAGRRARLGPGRRCAWCCRATSPLRASRHRRGTHGRLRSPVRRPCPDRLPKRRRSRSVPR